jgi:hypothetical protein
MIKLIFSKKLKISDRSFAWKYIKIIFKFFFIFDIKIIKKTLKKH